MFSCVRICTTSVSGVVDLFFGLYPASSLPYAIFMPYLLSKLLRKSLFTSAGGVTTSGSLGVVVGSVGVVGVWLGVVPGFVSGFVTGFGVEITGVSTFGFSVAGVFGGSWSVMPLSSSSFELYRVPDCLAR